MKSIKIFAVFVAVIMTTQGFAQVDEGNITTFEDGTPAVAGEVNANFQALVDAINSVADRVAALESGGGSSEGFSGNYTITGIGMSSDCQGTTGSSIALTLYGINGTGTAANGELSFTLTETGMDPILRDNGTGTFEVESRSRNQSDTSSIPFDSNGVFSGIDGGSFTTDGSAFVLVNSSAGCPGDITHLVGVRN